MASMLLTQRLICSFQHNYRLIVPGKPWGSWQELVLAEAMIQTKDSRLEESLEIQGLASQCFRGCPTILHKTASITTSSPSPISATCPCAQADSSAVSRELIHSEATLFARRWWS